jgi:hypothetical protein
MPRAGAALSAGQFRPVADVRDRVDQPLDRDLVVLEINLHTAGVRTRDRGEYARQAAQRVHDAVAAPGAAHAVHAELDGGHSDVDHNAVDACPALRHEALDDAGALFERVVFGGVGAFLTVEQDAEHAGCPECQGCE